jgi:hypothetical protein
MNDVVLLIVLYVDGLIIIGDVSDSILGLKKQLKDTFDMKDSCTLHFFLGIQII